jgi:hypothetical protein
MMRRSSIPLYLGGQFEEGPIETVDRFHTIHPIPFSGEDESEILATVDPPIRHADGSISTIRLRSRSSSIREEIGRLVLGEQDGVAVYVGSADGDDDGFGIRVSEISTTVREVWRRGGYWQWFSDAILAFAVQEGHTDVPEGHIESGMPLAGYVELSRNMYGHGMLSAELVAFMESFPGWSWSTPHQAEWERLVGTWLLPELPGFEVHGGGVYRTPVGWVLAGFNSEPMSIERDAFSVSVFAMPLFVPRFVLSSTIEQRLGAGSHRFIFDSDGLVAEELLPLLKGEGCRFLDAHSSPEALALASDWKYRDDMRKAECEAYTLLLIGETALALDLLNEIAAREPTREWHPEILGRCQMMAELVRGSPERVVAQLGEWRTFTLDKLKIPLDHRARVG